MGSLQYPQCQCARLLFAKDDVITAFNCVKTCIPFTDNGKSSFSEYYSSHILFDTLNAH
jgi:hypothetical protein